MRHAPQPIDNSSGTNRCRISCWKGGRFFAVHDHSGTLVCVCVYKRGAKEVASRIGEPPIPTLAPSARRSGRKRGSNNGRD